jgi:osmotically inducible protein OsmC
MNMAGTFSVFMATGRWSAAGRRGEVAVDGGQSVQVSVPAQFGGTEPGTNPEQLLLAAALSCYMMGLGRLCAQAGMAADPVSVAIVGEVSRTPQGLHFDRIRLRPVFQVPATAAERQKLTELAQQAEAACFIARTLRPVIPYELEVLFTEAGPA